MKDETAKINRIIEILYLLSRSPRKLHSTREILEHLEAHFGTRITPRDVQRDLVSLKEAVPALQITGERASGYRYSLRNNSINPALLKSFAINEVMACYALRSISSVFRGSSIEKAYDQFLEKVKDRLPDNVFSFVDENEKALDSSVTLKPFGSYDWAGQEDLFTLLMEAVAKRNKLKFRYRGPHGEFDRVIHPLRIVFSKGMPYLVALDEIQGEVRTYMVPRIVSAEKQTETFQISEAARKRLQEILTSGVGIFYGEGQQLQRVVLHFDFTLADRIATRIWHESQKTKKLAGGRMELKMKVPVNHELLSWVLSFETFVDVIEPEELRTMVREAAKRILEKTR